jgi:hypothetical protein
MAIKNILIKASGDISDNEEFFNFAKNKAKNNYVFVICGAGTKISEALSGAGYDIKYDDNHGRIIKTFKERKISRDVLEDEEKCLQDKFIGTGVMVGAPILNAGPVLCHINGDNLTKAYYLGFDEIYVFTLKSRIEKKKKIFKKYENVKIIGV